MRNRVDTLLALIAVLLAALVLIFGDNLYERLTGTPIFGNRNTPPSSTPQNLRSEPETLIYEVDAKKAWQDTGIVLYDDNFVEIAYVSGVWTVNYQSSSSVDPYTDADGNSLRKLGVYVSDPPVDTVLTAALGALIAKVDSGDPFLVGNSIAFNATSTGKLYLKINDGACQECSTPMGDNDGVIKVQIKVTR